MKPEINEIQEEIIEEFSLLENDMESTIFYIMEMGSKLPPLEEKYKVEENIVKGCQSKVWLVSGFENGKVIFKADSNTEITKGLISMLIRIWNERAPEEILDSELYFVERIGMRKVVGSQRSNGFASMIRQMKLYALAYKNLPV
ncbi:cysteine desulfuration protein SufE [Anseongella ginsenosidimutans]|uniref:Cysteine desulfuration protein SufE n=1 Tax=Anseongella ginsenosidimutans TaxID=496056 RepID=A0A4R3KSK6_9SPHI|nr:SufE family protein [Anseongella ginsenosidimutans]QEC53319.1 SufE family protein [Anseongella ginsenosidimutans]TCS88196.1 cysteine desulfuration protein SufE [Anseongella ginsenosidimutans]